MKNSNEMFNSLLERRDRYIAEQRKKRKAVIRTATPVCCLCLVVMLGVSIWQSGLLGQPDVPIQGDTSGQIGGSVGGTSDTQSPSSSAKDEYAVYTGTESSGGGADLFPANTGDAEIIVNELASEIPEKGFYNLRPENYYDYTKDELFDYYGIEFDISSIFPDMVERNTNSYGIFKSDDGKDIMGHVFIWTNLSSGEEVSIDILKDGTPKTDVNDIAAGGSPLASTISGEKAIIFHSGIGERSGYYAEFFHKGLGFAVYGYNFDEDDFVRVLSYLISC